MAPRPALALAAAMRLNDPAADGEPHACSIRLGGEKRLKDALKASFGKPNPGIAHGKSNSPSSVRVEAGATKVIASEHATTATMLGSLISTLPSCFMLVVCHGRAIVVRTDYTSGDVRRVARGRCGAGAPTACDRGGARRQLASQAAKIGGMDRQTLRDWVIRFNAQGPDGLVNKSSPGAPGKLTDEHKAFLTRLVEEGPIPAVDGVVRWRACDLIMRLHEELASRSRTIRSTVP